MIRLNRKKLCSKSGATLIEVLAAVLFLVAGAAFIGLIFPKSVQSSRAAGQRLIAQQLASSKMQDLKKNAFEYIAETPPPGVAGGFPASNVKCNCDDPALDFSTLYSSFTATSGTTGYTVAWCVNGFVPVPNAPPNTSCPPTPPTAPPYDHKNIRVRVTWKASNSRENYKLDQDSIVTRY